METFNVPKKWFCFSFFPFTVWIQFILNLTRDTKLNVLRDGNDMIESGNIKFKKQNLRVENFHHHHMCFCVCQSFSLSPSKIFLLHKFYFVSSFFASRGILKHCTLSCVFIYICVGLFVCFMLWEGFFSRSIHEARYFLLLIFIVADQRFVLFI